MLEILSFIDRRIDDAIDDDDDAGCAALLSHVRVKVLGIGAPCMDRLGVFPPCQSMCRSKVEAHNLMEGCVSRLSL